MLVPVLCPHCHRDHVVKGGKTASGTQRPRGHHQDRAQHSLLLDPA